MRSSLINVGVTLQVSPTDRFCPLCGKFVAEKTEGLICEPSNQMYRSNRLFFELITWSARKVTVSELSRNDLATPKLFDPVRFGKGIVGASTFAKLESRVCGIWLPANGCPFNGSRMTVLTLEKSPVNSAGLGTAPRNGSPCTVRRPS